MRSKNTRTRLIRRNGKKVRAHRWLMAQYLGRELNADEDVHHKNRDPLDNAIANLEVLSTVEHIMLHAKEKQRYDDYKNCAACGRQFKVNPRKRKRNKTCSPTCAMSFRIAGRKRQAAIKASMT